MDELDTAKNELKAEVVSNVLRLVNLSFPAGVVLVW